MFVHRSQITLGIIVLLAIALLVAARPGSSAGTEQRYVVQPGDTLWAIATAEYGGDPREAVWKIQKRNHMPSAAIAPGEVLLLPH